MRPLRLSLESFTSFRDPTEIDFTDADYFALVGPTGSGKSSVLDAMAFALYGAVPRYEDRRLVAPVITQGRVEARVGLDFAVGPERYRVVRVVRAARSKGGAPSKGATTKEARLERLSGPDGDIIETLAGDADSVTASVTALLGLSFEHFTKCVVLPQGAFARFLHDKPASRQDLLADLLGLGVYAQLGQKANQAAAAAANRAALADEQLARPPLVDAGPCAVAHATARVLDLERLQAVVVADEPILAELGARRADAQVRAEEALGRASSLAALIPPVGLDRLSVELRTAAEAQGAADAEVVIAEQDTTIAEGALETAPPRGVLEAAGQMVDERDDLMASNEKVRRVIAELAAAEAETATELERATARVGAARLGREAALHSHQAAALVHLLVAGQPCPVCQQAVSAAPVVGVLPDLDASADELRRAEQALTEVSAGHHEAAVRRAKGEAKLAAGIERLGNLDTKLGECRATLVRDWVDGAGGAGGADAAGGAGGAFGADAAGGAGGDLDRARVQSLLAFVDGAEEALSRARRAERRARGQRREAAERLAGLQRAGREAWDEFDRVRDRLAALGPPPVDRDDLPGAWAVLIEWAGERGPVEEHAARAALEEVSRIETQQRERMDSLVAACAAAALDVDDPAHRGRPLGEIVARALAQAIELVRRHESAASEAARLRAEADEARHDALHAHALGQHLKSSGFEKWLLDEVQAQLVSGATTLLRDLSNGAYSLTLDEAAGFAVVDHRNADLIRSARTLSGGETFLASLALALALADRLSGFAAEGAAPLEAIFLDEGFGALDPDTLDTVAAAIENLAAEGRVVGIVTHVRDLADRIPVRFEVEKGPTTSTVRRVEG